VVVAAEQQVAYTPEQLVALVVAVEVMEILVQAERLDRGIQVEQLVAPMALLVEVVGQVDRVGMAQRTYLVHLEVLVELGYHLQSLVHL
jgi:hypothetical protein